MSETVSMLTRADVVEIHDDIVAEYDNPEGMRNDVALDRIEMLPQEVFHSELADVMESLIRILVIEHSFVDGNKRTAVNCAAALAGRAGREFPVTKNLGQILKTLGVDERVVSKEGFESYIDEGLIMASQYDGLTTTEIAAENRAAYQSAYEWLERN